MHQYQCAWVGMCYSNLFGVSDGGKLGDRVPDWCLMKDVYTVGRDGCNILVPYDHADVSRKHFTITKRENLVYLEDSSTFGTFINGARSCKGKKATLKHNDRISLVRPEHKGFVYMDKSQRDAMNFPKDIKGKYAISRVLGKGAFGLVHLVFERKTSRRFAMKAIKKMANTKYIETEVKILRELDHPCVVHMEVLQENDRMVYIVLELMEGGDLFGMLTPYNKLNESTSKLMFYQVVLAVQYLHQRAITHRDLKVTNSFYQVVLAVQYLHQRAITHRDLKVVLAVKYLHQRDITHRDLKVTNSFYQLVSSCPVLASESHYPQRPQGNQLMFYQAVIAVQYLHQRAITHKNLKIPQGNQLMFYQVVLAVQYLHQRAITHRYLMFYQVVLAVQYLHHRDITHRYLMFYQVVLAVQSLHHRDITHRYLMFYQPQNILLASRKPETLYKVADFGVSKNEEDQSVLKTYIGTPHFMAPEILSQATLTYTKQVDVWALGVLLYLCLFSSFPFRDAGSVVKGDCLFPETKKSVLSTAVELITALLVKNPEKRLKVDEILDHTWLRDDEMKSKFLFLKDTLTRTSDVVFDCCAHAHIGRSEEEGGTASKGRYVEIEVMEPSMRKIKKSGYFNFVNKNDTAYRIRYLKDMVSTIIDMKWRWVLLILNASFFLTWFLFAILWWLIAYVHGDLDPEHLPEFQEAIGWIPCVTNIHNFTSAFMFSMENQHTTGFGTRMPTEECLDAIILMCWQGIVGVTLQAAFVGLIFAKLIRPKQRTNTLLFSRNALICKRHGKLCLLIRVGDLRKSNIIESKIFMQIIHNQITPEGEFLSPIRREMTIETPEKGTRFFLLWPETIVHWIDCNSPLYEISPDDLTKAKFEVIVLLEGTMDSTDQRFQARTSYMPDEILWGHNFQSMMSFNEDKQRYDVDYSLFDATNVVDTPMYSAKELDTAKPGITTKISSVTGMRKDEVRGSIPAFSWKENGKPFRKNHPQYIRLGFEH
uniref:Uncharacterized protein n=1 Tax=Timema poppense TaxID=170557 RepID=A0A7R9CV22_TIMPO|nr:unnamed protein product [Timema poppensis]